MNENFESGLKLRIIDNIGMLLQKWLPTNLESVIHVFMNNNILIYNRLMKEEWKKELMTT
jgi:hypothetical protein